MAYRSSGFGVNCYIIPKLNINVQGWWVDPPGHVFYLLADAPHAHAVNGLMTELKLFHWNTVDVHPIIRMDEAMPLAARYTTRRLSGGWQNHAC